MKKILIAMMMTFATIGTVEATEFNWNKDVVTQNIINQVIGQVLGNTVNVNTGLGNVQIHTGRTVTTGKMKQCWISPKYDSQGNVTNRLVCM